MAYKLSLDKLFIHPKVSSFCGRDCAEGIIRVYKNWCLIKHLSLQAKKVTASTNSFPSVAE
jgi:hypothetical protein